MAAGSSFAVAAGGFSSVEPVLAGVLTGVAVVDFAGKGFAGCCGLSVTDLAGAGAAACDLVLAADFSIAGAEIFFAATTGAGVACGRLAGVANDASGLSNRTR